MIWTMSISGSHHLPSRAIRKAFSMTDMGAKRSVDGAHSDPRTFLGVLPKPLGPLLTDLQIQSQGPGKVSTKADKDTEQANTERT